MSRYRLNKKKFAMAMITIIAALFIVYLVICYMDIALNNLSAGGSNSEWNLLLKFILTFCK